MKKSSPKKIKSLKFCNFFNFSYNFNFFLFVLGVRFGADMLHATITKNDDG